MVELLVSKGARKSLGDGDKNTPLHLACAEERGEVALWLIANGANTDRRNKVRGGRVVLPKWGGGGGHPRAQTGRSMDVSTDSVLRGPLCNSP